MTTAAATLSPPAALEAEQALLGAILVNNEAYATVEKFLRPEHFSEGLHASLFETMGQALAAGRRLTPHLLGSVIPADVKVGDLTGPAYIARLASGAATVVNAYDYGLAVFETARRRRLLEIAEEITAAAVRPSIAGADPVATDAIADLDDLLQTGARSAVPRLSLGDASDLAIGAAVAARQTGTGLLGASWGIRALDRTTLGLCRGDLVVPAGRPGMGKTTFGLAVALKAARAGHGVYLAELEMSGVQIGLRAVCTVASGYGPPILYERVARGDISEDDERRLRSAHERMRALPLEIEQEPGLTVSQIAARARQVRRKFVAAGTDLDLIIVDHIGLIAAHERRGGNKVAETEDVTGALKRMAKAEGVCVMALCQLSRAVEGRDDKRPQMSDLRWSGSIEQDADTVLGLFREEYYLNRKKDRSVEDTARAADRRNIMEVEILKQRMGGTHRVEIMCVAGTGVVDDLSRMS